MAEDEPVKLPSLHQALLDGPTLAQLFADLRACTRVIEVIVKHGARQMVDAQAPTLEEAHRLLASGQVRGVQVRYVYEQAQWWDTLIATPQGVRLTRIRHTFDDEQTR